MINLKPLIYFLFLGLIWVPQSISQTILIDPGHGGEDCGAKSFLKRKGKNKEKICEKDVALSISKKIQQNLSDTSYQVFLTRSIDREVTLEERARLADVLKADLFISVHINASTASGSNGFETFYLNNHDSAAVRRVEEIENRDTDGELNMVDKILTDLVIERTAPRSKHLADNIHMHIAKNIQKTYNLSDRGVKPALFYVLALTKRPAILLEAGFLSNKKELKMVTSDRFQDLYAKGVAQGLKEYLKKSPSPALF
jgi:N-acetylmuramoyl-L-alanine amidase